MSLLSTKQAAEKLGVSAIRIRQLIQDGTIKATRIGRDYVIDEKDLKAVKTYGKAGRPKKSD
jgi:excisionase family DNA binding protein